MVPPEALHGLGHGGHRDHRLRGGGAGVYQDRPRGVARHEGRHDVEDHPGEVHLAVAAAPAGVQGEPGRISTHILIYLFCYSKSN